MRHNLMYLVNQRMPYLNSMFGFSYGYILAPTQNPAQHPEKSVKK